LCTPYGAFAVEQAPLSDLGDFNTIENLMPFGKDAKPSQEQLYLRSVRDELTQTPVGERRKVLNMLSDQTKWGTSQRFIAYYVCAWYGVNYDRTRDYLLHSAFWWEWRIGPQARRPFSFDDVSIDLLYALYEHNHDFKILHDILTTKSDAGTGELLVGLTENAVAKHPRGVLHVAEMSDKGRNLACKLLHLSPHDENHPLYILYDTEESLKAFRIYVIRVAKDPKDPLSALAKKLLKKPTRQCQ
jgi:hypothetical protein